MAANPALVQIAPGQLLPAPYPHESFVLKRSGVQLELDQVQTQKGKWSTWGQLYLSNIRMVFVADKADPSGEVWSAAEDGGPRGSLPPHSFTVYFKEGGIGTFFPMYYMLATQAKQAYGSEQQQQQSQEEAVGPPPSMHDAQGLASRAFVDPNDPTTIFITQPVDESQRLREAPRYAANYGVDEKYEGGERAY
ncbi:hypothetical protein DUNSADRAFT_4008 [Dunaliella salina]|uniref:Uncharacterized protein n=1 Tax=Dunaliella salina TaxID=3046 RepID=A0ABQ7GSW5_DUNSA|nr:hypothetical protein DUNSADRAFT_4008 [Dunaliella salina]|eukprot:KAF5837699.1 hypothetical protein DUNSADRAFT_4008 [Dunaliella salina]